MRVCVVNFVDDCFREVVVGKVVIGGVVNGVDFE